MAGPVNQVELPAYALPQRSETGRKFKDFVQRNNSTRWARNRHLAVQWSPMYMPATVGISRFAAGGGDRHTALRGAIWAAMVAHCGGRDGMDSVLERNGITACKQCRTDERRHYRES